MYFSIYSFPYNVVSPAAKVFLGRTLFCLIYIIYDDIQGGVEFAPLRY